MHAVYLVSFPYGLVVRISGFHPDGPGSIPGVGTYHFFSSSSPFFFSPYQSHMSVTKGYRIDRHTR